MPLIRYVASKGKPIILSSGMATESELCEAYGIARTNGLGKGHVTALVCTSAYPADASQTNLKKMERFWEMGMDAGLSDHTQGIGVAVVAAGAGASVIEKHLILNRADGGLDAEFSLEPAEFTQMVAECRRAAVAIGTVQYGPSPGESTSLRRSLHFTKDLDAGLHAYADTLATARPAKGLPPAELPKVLGKRLKVAVSQGQPVTWDCFEE